MSLQPDLFGDELADPSLGENQRAVLRAWNEYGPLTDDEAGAAVHARQGKHGSDTRCGYCVSDGRPVIQSLRRRGLVGRGPRRTQPDASSDVLSRAEGVPW